MHLQIQHTVTALLAIIFAACMLAPLFPTQAHAARFADPDKEYEQPQEIEPPQDFDLSDLLAKKREETLSELFEMQTFNSRTGRHPRHSTKSTANDDPVTTAIDIVAGISQLTAIITGIVLAAYAVGRLQDLISAWLSRNKSK